MSVSAPTPQQSVADRWQPIELQLVVFPVDPEAAVQNQQWWQEVTGGVESELSRKKGTTVEQAIVGGHLLRLEMDPLRVRWFLTPAAAEDREIADVLASLPTLGPFSEVRDWFLGLLRSWVERFAAPVKRLAINGKMFQPADNRVAAYTALSHYIPAVRIDPESTDFQYRVNRKRDSGCGIDDLKINRLSTWSVISVAMRARAVMKESGQQRLLKGPETFGCLLESDVNSVPDFAGILPSNGLLPLLDELSGMTTEICERGDVP